MDTQKEKNFVALNGKHGQQLLDAVKKDSPRLHRYLCEYLGDDLYQDNTLPLKTRLLCVISALAATGGLENPLKFYVRTALANDCSKAEIISVIETVATYSGTPKAFSALFIALEVCNKFESQHDVK